MLFLFPASCLHPGSVADIRHLDNNSKGVSPSSPILVLKSSQNVTSTTQTCLRVGFQHRENLLLLLSLPPFCFSRVNMIRANLLTQLAWTNTGRTCSSYCLSSPPLVLELGLQSNPLDLLGPPLPSAKILLETCFFESWFDSFDTWWSPEQIGRKIAKKGGISCQRSPIYRRKVTFCREDREMWRG